MGSQYTNGSALGGPTNSKGVKLSMYWRYIGPHLLGWYGCSMLCSSTQLDTRCTLRGLRLSGTKSSGLRRDTGYGEVYVL